MHYGLTIPFDGLSLAEHRELYDIALDAGYTDLWSSEVSSADAFTPLVTAAVTRPELRLGTAIVPAFTRSPALLAMSAASLADTARSEVLLGLGASSDVIVERWNGVPFQDPYGRVRDVVSFLRLALTGERVDFESPSFTIRGFRLTRVPQRQPRLLIAALRPGMLRLAGRLSDGTILNWLSPDDVRKVVPHVARAHPRQAPEVVARLFVIPTTDIDFVRTTAKRSIAAYLNVPVYAAFHEWLGRGPVLQPMWEAWRAGDRKAALEAIPDSLVDELFIHGTPDDCRRRIEQYVEAGVTTPMLSINVVEGTVADNIKALGRLSANR